MSTSNQNIAKLEALLGDLLDGDLLDGSATDQQFDAIFVALRNHFLLVRLYPSRGNRRDNLSSRARALFISSTRGLL